MNKNLHHIFIGSILLFLLSACDKSQEGINHPANPVPQFTKYTIKAGEHYCDKSVYKQTNYTELKFVVKFDSSAIYQTVLAANQFDINKLYGFSDNSNEHHQFSARFGWRWSDGALRLFGYIYNNGIMSFEELGTISIGQEYNCSIKISSTGYVFTLNNTTRTLPRATTAATAIGYKLYPYFGGDEAAPHEVHIWIKEL